MLILFFIIACICSFLWFLGWFSYIIIRQKFFVKTYSDSLDKSKSSFSEPNSSLIDF